MLDGQLPVKDTMTLVVERPWWKFDGMKAAVIRERFGESRPATTRGSTLDRLLDEPAALAFDPMLVRRLRRQREARQQAGGPRRAGWASAAR